jgi:colicin import membrane protein
MSLRHLLALVLLVAGVARAQGAALNVITEVSVRDEGRSVVLAVRGSKPPNFTTFSMADPPRFVIDFSESRFQGVPGELPVNDGTILLVKNLSYGSDASSIARIMLAFVTDVDPPDVAAAGDTLLVRIAKPSSGGDVVVAQREDAGRQEREAAEARARAEAEAQARIAAEQRARDEALAQAEREAHAAQEARARAEEERRAAEEAARAAANEGLEADRRARAEAEALARAEVEAELRAEARTEAERQARARAEEERHAAAVAAEERRAAEEARREALRQAETDAERQREEAAALARVDAERQREEERERSEAARAEAERQQREALERREADRLAREEEQVQDAEAARLAGDAEAQRREEERVALAAAREQERRAREDVQLAVPAPSAQLREIGFRQLPGISRVYVRTSATPRFTIQDVGEDTIRVELENTRIATRNDTRHLDTSFFPGAVALISPSRKGSTYVVDIKLKQRVPYQQRIEGDVLAVDFERPGAPAGAEAVADGIAPDAATAPDALGGDAAN